jgi:hypothetical protein
MARKRGRRFRKVADAQAQFESIEKTQRRIRQGKEAGRIIDSVEKSRQRDRNARKQIRRPTDVQDEIE